MTDLRRHPQWRPGALESATGGVSRTMWRAETGLSRRSVAWPLRSAWGRGRLLRL